jgi:predicted  nucleic acid-binding Zn-ribbon protein
MRQRATVGLTLAFVKASPDAQLRLLELADLDTELARLDHRRRALPEIAELEALTARAAEIRDAITRAGTELADLGREQARAERDVEQVRARIDRDSERLDAGNVSSARELESLQNEIVSLRRRQGDLEEIVLGLMERAEAAQARHDAAAAEAEKTAAEIAAVTSRRDAALAEIGAQQAKASSSRALAAAAVPGDLLALYDKVRSQVGGAAAAMLRRGECQGCRVALSTVELNEVRAAAPDEVLRHEECRRILVRTAESGL